MFWAQQRGLIKPRLGWAADYFAVSVSDAAVQHVREYIRNQEAHHKRYSFIEEYTRFVTDSGRNPANSQGEPAN